MSGKCSSTCLQFIINFLKPSQSYGSGGPVPAAPSLFRGQMCLCLCFIMFIYMFSQRQPQCVETHVAKGGPRAHSLSAGVAPRSLHTNICLGGRMARLYSNRKTVPFFFSTLLPSLCEFCPVRVFTRVKAAFGLVFLRWPCAS